MKIDHWRVSVVSPALSASLPFVSALVCPPFHYGEKVANPTQKASNLP